MGWDPIGGVVLRGIAAVELGWCISSLFAAAVALAAVSVEAKPLVVFADIRESEPADSFGFASNAAVKAGCDFAVRKGKNSEWESGELCKDADVLVFTGGMNDYSGILATQKGRLVVHLLDRSETDRDVTSASLRINGDRPIMAVYRPGGKPLVPTNRTVSLDKFNVYDMVVVEF